MLEGGPALSPTTCYHRLKSYSQPPGDFTLTHLRSHSPVPRQIPCGHSASEMCLPLVERPSSAGVRDGRAEFPELLFLKRARVWSFPRVMEALIRENLVQPPDF